MQSDNQIQDLLKKFILNQCTKAEIEEVITYIEEITKSNQLPTVEDVLELLEEKPILSEIDANRIHDAIINNVSKREKTALKKKSYFWKYAVAASIVFLVSIPFFLNKNNDRQLPNPILVNSIEAGTDKATLTLGDGSQIALEKGGAFQTKNANSNGEAITYKAGTQKTVEVEYNYLTIPRGGQFQIVLSDGTQVWLNSESQLKFPVNFIEGETRKVELVYGEAYFDVSPSTEHKGSKFKVLNQFQEVEVLGTEFNIKAYKDETNVYTTLVEGKVAVDNGRSKQNLIPNQQSNLSVENNNIKVSKVDVKSEISWKNGIFSFSGKPLKDIMKVISRWYDVDIIFKNKDLENLRFKGSINKNKSIEEVLLIMKSNTIKNYEIREGKTIILE